MGDWRAEGISKGLGGVAFGKGIGLGEGRVRVDVCGPHQAALTVMRGAVVDGVCGGGSPEGGGGVGEDVVRIGGDFDVFGLDDAVAVEAGDPLRLREAAGGVGRIGPGVVCRRRRLAPSTRAIPQARFPRRATTTGFAFLVELEAGGVADALVGQGHELVEDGELELEFDAVHHRLQRRFDLVPVVVFHGEQDQVHGDDDQIDPDQLRHHLSRFPVVDRSQESDGRGDVDARDDELLHTERRHLQLLHHVEGSLE